eukprot:3014443-Prymnesium_polylepis.1
MGSKKVVGWQPFGPIEDDVEARVSLKRCQFVRGKGCGYDRLISCTEFRKDADVHVASFKLSNMFQDYGLNAIALVVDKAGDANKLQTDEWTDHFLIVRSQFAAPFETSIWTLVLMLDKKTVRLYAQDGRTATTGKRKHDTPQWYFPTAADEYWTAESTDSGDTFWFKEWEISELRDPIVRFRMRSSLANVVEIVPVPTVVTDHLAQTHCVAETQVQDRSRVEVVLIRSACG